MRMAVAVAVLLEPVVVGYEVVDGRAEVVGVGGADKRISEIGMPDSFRQCRAVIIIVDQVEGDVEVLLLAAGDQLGEAGQRRACEPTRL